MKSIFYEEQRFRQPLIMMVVVSVVALMWYAAIQQLVFKLPFGQNPMPDLAAFIYWIVFGIGLPILFISACLISEVREDGVYFRFIPFHRTFGKILFEDIAYCEEKTYNPICDYGGWGIRWRCKGRAYNVSGNKGVQFELKNGKRILIGSQRSEEFWQAIPERVRTRTGSAR